MEKRSAVVATMRALLAGSAPSLAVIVATVFVQRLVLPLAVLWLDTDDRAFAVAGLLVAALLSFARTGATDRLVRGTRLNLLEMYLVPFERGPIARLPSSELATAKLGTTLPVVVSWAVDGVAVVLTATFAVPAVVALLGHALGLLALVPLGAAGAVGAIVTMASAARVEAAWNRAWDRSRGILSSIVAGYDGAVDLRAHGRARVFADKLRAEISAWSDDEGRARLAGTMSTWGAFGATLAAGVGVSALLGRELAPRGDVYRTSLLVIAAIPTVQALVNGVAALAAARGEIAGVAEQRAEALSAPAEEIDEPIDATAELSLAGVRYSYPAAGEPTAALDGVDLVLPARGSLVITGPNGAGKTTLLHVLLGVVRPDQGRVLVGGRPARLDNRRWRERVAFLSQRPYELCDGTIADNLRALDPGASDERLVAALEMVGLRAALRSRAPTGPALLALPYAALSRGQARRVMLARALLRDADLLVLDEPEAHLDAESVAELAGVLRSLARDRRVVAAVHDPALTTFAGAVLELEAPRRTEPRPAEVVAA